MKKSLFGFTLIEISLFLAITSVIFISIAAGTQNSISQQRFNDTVQNYDDFLTNIYSGVSNPQSVGDGRSEYAIYGKLVTFDEKFNLVGDANADHKIFVYDVIGGVEASKVSTGGVVDLLEKLDANVVILGEEDGVSVLAPAGVVESYTPRWAAVIETTTENEIYKGALLVVRHPKSGTVNTLVLKNKTVEVNEAVKNAKGLEDKSSINPLKSLLKDFSIEEVDFCINMFAGEENTVRQDVRLAKNARNASGIEIVSIDSEANRCRTD